VLDGPCEHETFEVCPACSDERTKRRYVIGHELILLEEFIDLSLGVDGPSIHEVES